MAKKDSQVIMYEHSEVKVKLLRTYLEMYFNILSRDQFTNEIHYYDLFSSVGIYENGGEGSPVVVLKTIKDTFFSLKNSNQLSCKFNITFNDLDLNTLNTLRENITQKKLHYPEIGELRYLNEDYKSLIPSITKEINSLSKGNKSFIFIDPYGYKEIRISHIKDILINKKSEVLLFLPTHFMFRFNENGTPESLIEFIKELVPYDQWPKTTTGLDFIEILNDHFKTYLGNDFFVDNFAISRDKNQFFCLFFFTSHIYGFEKMIDAKWSLDEEDGRGWKYNSTFDLFSQIQKSPNVEKFERKLIDFLTIEKSNKEVYEFTLRNGHKPSHTNEILRKLDSKVEVKSYHNGKIRKGAFYLNFDGYKEKNPKILIKIK